jgi:WD40 repeat protein
MPIPEAGVDSLAQAVDANNEIQYNGMVNVIAGWEDGSIVRTEVHIPEQEDNNQEYKDASNEDYASEGHQLKHGSKRNMLKPKNLPNRFANNEILHPQKPNELVYLHKDWVTSICQRPSYPFQFLTTSLDGEASLWLLSNTLSQEELVILRFSNKICDEGIGEAAWMDANCFIVKNEAYGQLLLQDVREGEGKSPTHLYTTSSLCKINNMDVNFPYVGVAQDDGALAILDLRHIDIDQNYELKPLFEVNKHGEACMWVKLLKDTIRIYGCYERSGIYGYRFENEELAHDNTEWHGFYDSDKYGLPKSLHVIHQEKANNSDENSVYCQDVLWIGTYNGSYVYGLVDEEEHIEMQP